MSYKPQFTVTPLLLNRVGRIAALRQRIVSATVDVAWIPALQADTRVRNAHSSTAIEGNPLTLEQVRAVEEGRELPAAADRPRREVLNYFAGLRYVEKHAGIKTVRHEDLFELHRIVAAHVMDQIEAGLIEREGTRKSGCYRLARQALTAHTEKHDRGRGQEDGRRGTQGAGCSYKPPR